MTNKILKILLKPMKQRNIGELLNMMKFYQTCTNGEFRLAYALDGIQKSQSDKEVENQNYIYKNIQYLKDYFYADGELGKTDDPDMFESWLAQMQQEDLIAIINKQKNG